MNSAFKSFLNKGYTYNYRNGPNVITSEKQALQEGINCIGLMHVMLKELFDATLPSNLRVLEIFHDNPYFTTVDSIKDVQLGDILFLGKNELPEYVSQYHPQFNEQKQLINEDEGRALIGEKHAGYHTVMYIGENDASGRPLVIDIQKATNEVKVWNLDELMKDEQYQKLYKIKRLSSFK